ncbi:MAG TPA: hypothetical protein PK867_23120 [Pirellulales bacterium]|nr:hypothetical protein [Pirellulales bacterium]
MPIPPSDNILNVLPPHLGDPTDPAHLSPYPCTMVELCVRFATSAKRRQILHGLLELRKEFFDLGIQGFQWLDGSILEDIEMHEGRDPGDIDVVTYVANPLNPRDVNDLIVARKPVLFDQNHIKANFSVDHFLVPLGSAPPALVYLSRYWYSLFSHRRDRVWKGMLAVELVDRSDDTAANTALGATP